MVALLFPRCKRSFRMDINAVIGQKIKDLRNQNGLTQQELADRTELTKGYISQLERGQVAPSVATLVDLVECLGTDMSEFFKETQNEQIVFKASDYFEKLDEEGNSTQWTVPMAQKNQMEPLLVEIQPHQKLAEHKPHDGEEYGYVLAGKIHLHLGDKVYSVGKGESFYFEATKKHYIENTGARPAKLVWISTPPTF